MQHHPTSQALTAMVFDESDLITALTSYAALNGLALPLGRVTLRLRSGHPITELALETATVAPDPTARVTLARPPRTTSRPSTAMPPPLPATTLPDRSAVFQANFC